MEISWKFSALSPAARQLRRDTRVWGVAWAASTGCRPRPPPLPNGPNLTLDPKPSLLPPLPSTAAGHVASSGVWRNRMVRSLFIITAAQSASKPPSLVTLQYRGQRGTGRKELTPLLLELPLLRQEAGLANFQVTSHIIRWLSHTLAQPHTLCC